MKLLFPGSFDPFTVGHADIVSRALRLADHVVVAVGVNSGKKPMFTPDERIEAISRYYEGNDRVSVIAYDGLTIKAARETGADAILRGVRSNADYEMERNLADINRALDGTETIIMVTSPEYQHISSSMVRELIGFGHPVDGMMIDTFKNCK